jgi:hypothetical protein
VEEQIELVEALWDNIVERNAVPGPTEAQKAELDRLIAALLLFGAVAASAWILGSILVHPANHTVPVSHKERPRTPPDTAIAHLAESPAVEAAEILEPLQFLAFTEPYRSSSGKSAGSGVPKYREFEPTV